MTSRIYYETKKLNKKQLFIHIFMPIIKKILSNIPVDLPPPRDCFDVYVNGINSSGIAKIYPDGHLAYDVFCDLSTPGERWNVSQELCVFSRKIHV